eukprot:Skav221558  [mRNA]  locus=scaffold1376:227077:227757:- [translate_table: standard]
MGACDSRAGVDDEEVQLRGCCKNADSQLERGKVQALSARDPQDVPGSDLVDLASSSVKKDAMATLAASFAQGRELEISSMIHGAGTFIVAFNEDFSEMKLEETSEPARKFTIPLIYVLNASIDNSPGLQRYSLTSTLRVRVGPYAGHGPDTILLQLDSHRECSAMGLFLCASSKHLQKSSGWERQRLMDDESVATTMIRSVQGLKDPQGLAQLLLKGVGAPLPGDI